MKTKKKILVALALVGCAILLVAGSIAGTLAYLKDETGVVSNTFTTGNVAITLDETDVDLYGVKDGEARVMANQYKLIPGHTYVKDPTIHVTAGSEACYLFVKVENNLGALEVAAANGDTIAEQMTTLGWKQIGNGNYWYYNNGAAENAGTAIDARTEAKDVKVFNNFTVATDAAIPADASTLAVNITAYAVQADGFANAMAAWDATYGANS